MIEEEILFLLLAGIGGAVFGELTLRSWRELAQIFLHRQVRKPAPGLDDQKNRTTCAEIEDQNGPSAIQSISGRIEEPPRGDNRSHKIEPPPPGGILRFLLLKGGALLMLAVLLQRARTISGFTLLLVFLGVYVVYLFLRGWSMRSV